MTNSFTPFTSIVIARLAAIELSRMVGDVSGKSTVIITKDLTGYRRLCGIVPASVIYQRSIQAGSKLIGESACSEILAKLRDAGLSADSSAEYAVCDGGEANVTDASSPEAISLQLEKDRSTGDFLINVLARIVPVNVNMNAHGGD